MKDVHVGDKINVGENSRSVTQIDIVEQESSGTHGIRLWLGLGINKKGNTFYYELISSADAPISITRPDQSVTTDGKTVHTSYGDDQVVITRLET